MPGFSPSAPTLGPVKEKFLKMFLLKQISTQFRKPEWSKYFRDSNAEGAIVHMHLVQYKKGMARESKTTVTALNQ